MSIDEHIAAFCAAIERYEAAGQSIVASSSFQTQSMPLLHLISQHAPRVPVYFLDTGFHFPETQAFRTRVARELDLDVRVVASHVPLVGQRTSSGMFLWTEDTDRCCELNKTQPMEPVLAEADVWITGVRRDQSSVRAEMSTEAQGAFGVTRFHPMLEWTRAEIWAYVSKHELPRHPLELLGYESVGCQPCTARPTLDGDRTGRWQGQQKVECGLHTVLASG